MSLPELQVWLFLDQTTILAWVETLSCRARVVFLRAGCRDSVCAPCEHCCRMMQWSRGLSADERSSPHLVEVTWAGCCWMEELPEVIWEGGTQWCLLGSLNELQGGWRVKRSTGSLKLWGQRQVVNIYSHKSLLAPNPSNMWSLNSQYPVASSIQNVKYGHQVLNAWSDKYFCFLILWSESSCLLV